jgi:starch-binding outer membrane protein, SusD/RagB family
MLKINKILYSLTALMLMCSCRKFVTIPPPVTQVETKQVFENEQAATAATTGVYSQMMQTSLGLTNGGATLYPALSSDELINTAANTDYDAFRLNAVLPTSVTGLNRLWNIGYKNIYQANAVIEGLTGSHTISAAVANQLKGEMLVVRALHYFYLVNLFGDVPLITTTNFEKNATVQRTAVADVYNQIISDLQEAKGLLVSNYPSAGRVRPNLYTAEALLSRVYIYVKNWPEAEKEASAIINSGNYSLVSNLNNVFVSGSNEAIWQLSPVSTTINTAEGNQFIPLSATSRPAFAITSYLLNSFEPGDQRKAAWLKSNVVAGQTYYYPNKYKVRSGAPPYVENYMVFRLGEVYLIRAEARAQQNNIAAALDDLNKIRARAGLPNANTGNMEAVLSMIMQERRIELLLEWGQRWLDLKRTGTANAVLSQVKGPGWQLTDILYPIPQYELESNPLLVQNPGY